MNTDAVELTVRIAAAPATVWRLGDRLAAATPDEERIT
jgi:hypothetical protein